MDLHDLTLVGPRVSGSRDTDVVEVEKFVGILEDIRKRKSNAYDLEFEEQFPTGTFFMDDDEGHTSSYSKVKQTLETGTHSFFIRNSVFSLSCSIFATHQIEIGRAHV